MRAGTKTIYIHAKACVSGSKHETWYISSGLLQNKIYCHQHREGGRDLQTHYIYGWSKNTVFSLNQNTIIAKGINSMFNFTNDQNLFLICPHTNLIQTQGCHFFSIMKFRDFSTLFRPHFFKFLEKKVTYFPFKNEKNKSEIWTFQAGHSTTWVKKSRKSDQNQHVNSSLL